MSTGAELNSAVAAGVLAISRYHGGAIEEGMKLFLDVAKRMDEKGGSTLTITYGYVKLQTAVRMVEAWKNGYLFLKRKIDAEGGAD